MFEADWIMKQLSLGIEVVSTDPLQHREMVIEKKLKDLGLKPQNQFPSSHSEKDGTQWYRKWLVVKKIQMKKLNSSEQAHRLFEIEDIEIGVDARQQERDKDGILRDKTVQDPNSKAYLFAQKFTEIYDEIA